MALVSLALPGPDWPNGPPVRMGDAYECPYGDIAEDGSINGS